MRGAEPNMPHALLIPLPLQGHISPTMQLARKLVSDGFHVTFINTDFNHQRIIQANGNKKFTHDGRDKIRMISVPDGLPPEDRRNNVPNLLQALQNSLGPPVIRKLIQEINDSEEEEKITCIIADVWTCFGLYTVAQHFEIPLAAFHTSLVSTCAIRYFGSRLVSLGIVSQDGSPREDQKVKYLPSMPPLDSSELPWRYGGEYMFRLGMRTGEGIKPIKWVLFNTISELEAPVVDELSKEVGVYPIGPLFPYEFQDGETPIPSFWADDVECLGWLDRQSSQSVIYVSFGSLAVWCERQVEEFALGLQASQRPFLWVVRSDLMDGTKAVFPPGFLEGTRDRGCIVSWAPQLRVLSHPSIACFVTHCGWNSVQESITMGVPMLCSPYFADQFINRTYIVDVWKAGLPLNANQDGIIENGELTKAVKRLVMEEEGVQIRKEVSKLKSIARNAVKEGGSSSNNYKLFVKEMKRQLIG
uniref:Glycosyltransferase n=1 Tax=Wollemia nobilis TaxID=56998 RepID=A0A0C9QVF0_9CONI